MAKEPLSETSRKTLEYLKEVELGLGHIKKCARTDSTYDYALRREVVKISQHISNVIDLFDWRG